MLGSSVAVLLVALLAVRFPEVPLFALLPAVIATGIAAVLPPGRGAWIAGLLAGALLARLPGGFALGLVTAGMPVLAVLARRVTGLHPAVVAPAFFALAAYLAAVAGSGSWTLLLAHPLDACAALAIGATLSALAYAPTQGERLGPGGRPGFRLR